MKSTTTTTSSIVRKQNSKAIGKIFGTLFFGVFFLLGAGFTLFLVTDFQKTIATHSWKEVPGEIHAVTIKRNQRNNEDNTPYELEIQYSYEDGENRFNKTEGGEDHRYSMYEYAEEIASAHPIGSTRTVYVNPADSADSILVRKSLWTGLLLLLPLLFVIVGGGGLFYTWFSSRRATQPNEPASSSIGLGFAKYLGYAFLLGGGVGLYFFLQFAELNWRAQSWVETPARVLESAIITHESTDSDGHTSITYSLDIFYEYTFQDQTYRASRYEFSSGSSSGYHSKKQILDRYPPGSETVAYVNPADPKQATLNNGLSWFLLIGLLPLIFFGLGLLMVFGTKKSAEAFPSHGIASSSSHESSRHGIRPSGYSSPSGERVLKAQASPKAKLFGSIFVCLFWNGIVSIFLYQAYAAWSAGEPDWSMMLFLIPFVLVGLVIIFGVLYFFLALFNPTVEVTLSKASPRLGEEIEVGWKTEGSVSRLSALTLEIEGREQVRYRRGTNTVTKHHTFYKQEFATSTNPLSIKTGSARLVIPKDSMHTFDATNNKIEWQLKVRGTIARWPDVSEDYSITILPMEGA